LTYVLIDFFPPPRVIRQRRNYHENKLSLSKIWRFRNKGESGNSRSIYIIIYERDGHLVVIHATKLEQKSSRMNGFVTYYILLCNKREKCDYFVRLLPSPNNDSWAAFIYWNRFIATSFEVKIAIILDINYKLFYLRHVWAIIFAIFVPSKLYWIFLNIADLNIIYLPFSNVK